MRVIQINLQHCIAASAALEAVIKRDCLDMALIQEPWVTKGRIGGLGLSKGWKLHRPPIDNPRACILAREDLNLFMLGDLCCRDTVAVRWKVKKEGGNKDCIFVSAYLPYDQDGAPPRATVQRVVRDCRGKNLQLIIGCDANAHHTMWGSSDINNRGEYPVDYIIANDLEVLNIGDEPTFAVANKREVINITVCTAGVNEQVQKWHVSSEVSLSDHRYIRFDVGTKIERIYRSRNPRNTNWEAYRADLSVELDNCPGTINSIRDLELVERNMREAVITAFEKNCPLKERKAHKNARWWNLELEALRRDTRTLFNRAKRAGCWEQYRTSLTNYSYAVRRAKREAWRKLCEDVEETPQCSRIQKVLSREPTGNLGAIRLPDGKYTEGMKEGLAYMLKTHFPGSRILTENHGLNNQILDFTDRARRQDWQIARTIVSVPKTKWAINSFKPYKSSGEDGIIPAMLQQGQEILAPILALIMRASLAYGYIPESWRKVKVVFIPKPGKGNYALAKSYRPISLSSFVQKTLEKLVDRHMRGDVLVSRGSWPVLGQFISIPRS